MASNNRISDTEQLETQNNENYFLLFAHIKNTFNLFPHEGISFLSGISSWTEPHFVGFPDSSVSKESACNAGDPSRIPEWERPAVEGIGYPLQNSWACLVLSW